MSRITKRDLIIEKYNQLLVNVKEITAIEILPSLEEYELSQLVWFFDFFFTNDDYIGSLKKLMQIKGLNIDEQTFQNVYPSIKEFLEFFKELRSKD